MTLVQTAKIAGRRARAFTLLEMLMVLVIIGILAGLALPAIRGSMESRVIDAASRQVLDDLSFARQKAISQRSTVAMVFVPADVVNMNFSAFSDRTEQEAVKRLQGGAYTTYALFAFRRVGEQPGITTNRGYITEWKTLPEKTFFETNQFDSKTLPAIGVLPTMQLPFPLSHSQFLEKMPYIAFDEEGRRVDRLDTLTGRGVFPPFSRIFSPALPHSHQPNDNNLDIEIARGAVFYARDAQGAVDPTSFQIQEIPSFNSTQNVIHVDSLTGRAKWIKSELK
jgi:prepilin-type N-terminal cleavage/methylation domain-containing protein